MNRIVKPTGARTRPHRRVRPTIRGPPSPTVLKSRRTCARTSVSPSLRSTVGRWLAHCASPAASSFCLRQGAFSGQFEAQQSAANTLLVAGGAITVVMLMLLQLATGSLRVAIIVMVNLPLAVIGGVIAIFIADSVLHVKVTTDGGHKDKKDKEGPGHGGKVVALGEGTFGSYK
ncbi:MAG TPA: efflux RND transporter permease subunit [Terriglobales bacterium]|nr:efflux RND transporter permease subunit [Terriglobales bacterium]